ncbi:MAG: hypothetical protein P0Y56_07540 [Candidatus Andeanibacterium colombiense]|uniref:Lipoprotein n=1 Tax=Candidatus Andeanibacterium colombiense TaxID=3121345 RepID=A0AAJ5X9M8_9SPHN|nr:MAG: hypothetical protein P0Y56_07540 [Sphingomonadaceae bacterium]
MNIRSVLILVPLLAPALLLGACQKKADDTALTAKGEVLDGTIKDSQLPLDTLTSQPPLAPSQAKPGAAGSEDASDAALDQDPASLDAEQPAVESAVE